MPAVLILLVLGVGAWAWFTGRLKGFSYEDGAAAVLFLLGLRLLTTGRMLIGAALMAGAILWFAWRRSRAPTIALTAPEARALLGVQADASLTEIRDAHRRLISRVHPDAGGSEALAQRINAARDTLVAEMNRKPPRAS